MREGATHVLQTELGGGGKVAYLVVRHENGLGVLGQSMTSDRCVWRCAGAGAPRGGVGGQVGPSGLHERRGEGVQYLGRACELHLGIAYDRRGDLARRLEEHRREGEGIRRPHHEGQQHDGL